MVGKIRVNDIVIINDIDGDAHYAVGVIEELFEFPDMTMYAVRSPYTGIRYSRDASELTAASKQLTAQTRQDMRALAGLA